MYNFLQSLDKFGYSVDLHFGRQLSKNRQGDKQYKTIGGAFCSLIVISIWFVCVGWFLYKLISKTANKI